MTTRISWGEGFSEDEKISVGE